MRVKIKDVAIIQSGVYLKDEPDADVLYLQVKDFNINGESNVDLIPSVKYNEKIEKYLLSQKDLLFAAKGTTNYCIVYNEDLGKGVASSSFLVIKINDQTDLLPEYLSWYLNHTDIMQKLKLNAVGSSMPSITKSMIGDIEVSIPSLAKQLIIVKAANLQLREQELYKKIVEKRKILLDKLLINAINEK